MRNDTRHGGLQSRSKPPPLTTLTLPAYEPAWCFLVWPWPVPPSYIVLMPTAPSVFIGGYFTALWLCCWMALRLKYRGCNRRKG
jgi:hypothetical protein